MGGRGEGNQSQKGGIVLGESGGDIILWRYEGRVSLSYFNLGNVKNLGRDTVEERLSQCHGDFAGGG